MSELGPLRAFRRGIEGRALAKHDLEGRGLAGVRLVNFGHLGDGNLHFNINQRAGSVAAQLMAIEPKAKRAIHGQMATSATE